MADPGNLEYSLIVQQARLAKKAQRVATKQRNAAEARQAELDARTELAEEITASVALLTPEQRETLRPILASTA